MPQAALSDTPQTVDGFQLYMEPVMALSTREVHMYFALPALPARDGRFYMGQNAHLRARTLGRAGALQEQTLREAVHFVAALRQRGGSLPVICPLDVAALAHVGTSARILHMLREAAHAREGLLLAAPVEDMARASRAARQHLLELAELVAGFVTRHTGLPDVDTPLPLPLNVRCMEAPASALGLAAQILDVADYLRKLNGRGQMLLASGVDDEDLLKQIQGLATLGRGRYLGAPRRVRLPGGGGQAAGSARAQGTGHEHMPARAAMGH